MNPNPSFISTEEHNANLERLVEQYLSELLESRGFARYRGNSRRWHKATHEVITSVQFVSDRSFVIPYFGFQPIYIPFRFLDGPMRLHDRIWTFFDAFALQTQALPETERSSAAEMYLFSSIAAQGARYRSLLEGFVLPILDGVKDNVSCHNAYREIRKIKKYEAWDPRWVMECISLDEREECRRIAREILPAMADTLPLSDDGWEPTVEKEVAMRELNDGDFSRYRALMERFTAENIRRLKRARLL